MFRCRWSIFLVRVFIIFLILLLIIFIAWKWSRVVRCCIASRAWVVSLFFVLFILWSIILCRCWKFIYGLSYVVLLFGLIVVFGNSLFIMNLSYLVRISCRWLIFRWAWFLIFTRRRFVWWCRCELFRLVLIFIVDVLLVLKLSVEFW